MSLCSASHEEEQALANITHVKTNVDSGYSTILFYLLETVGECVEVPSHHINPLFAFSTSQRNIVMCG